jgi:hypothetical protein
MVILQATVADRTQQRASAVDYVGKDMSTGPAGSWLLLLEMHERDRMMWSMKRAEEMRELFARWKCSGQSLLAFGKAEGVGYAKLLYWRKKLGDDARRESSPAKPTLCSLRFPH